MEADKYYMSLRKNKYNSEKELNKNNIYNNEYNEDFLENRKRSGRYNNIFDKRKTPLILTPKLMLNNDNNNNNSIKIEPSKSIDFRNRVNNNFINYNSQKDLFIKMDEDDSNILTMHWKYDGPTNLNLEKKHFPKKKNIGNYFKTTPYKKSDYIQLNESDNNNLQELNPNYKNKNKNSFNNYNIDNNYNKDNEKDKEKDNEYNNNNGNNNRNYNNNNPKSQNIINNREQKSKSYNKKGINPFPHNYNDNDNDNDYIFDEKSEYMVKRNKDNRINYNNNNNEYIFDEKSEYMVKRNKDNRNNNINITNNESINYMNTDNIYGNKKYKYYNPKRNDYRGSNYGDYSYNYYLNAPMRGDKSQNWEFPPLYYYKPKYN